MNMRIKEREDDDLISHLSLRVLLKGTDSMRQQVSLQSQ
jgi:hypothetical protein